MQAFYYRKYVAVCQAYEVVPLSLTSWVRHQWRDAVTNNTWEHYNWF